MYGCIYVRYYKRAKKISLVKKWKLYDYGNNRGTGRIFSGEDGKGFDGDRVWSLWSLTISAPREFKVEKII